jgi:hypothetical protein
LRFEPLDNDQRRWWLGLFTIGMMHGLGWGGRYFGQHREFLEMCYGEDWLDTFAAPTSTADDWLEVIDEYDPDAAGDPAYYFWMRRLFVGIRQVALHLDDYVEAFRVMRDSGVCALADVLRPRASPVFQGGGVDAPSLAGVLGLGACFVVRELVRSGLLNCALPRIRKWCYPPVASVRRLLTELGCNGHDRQPDRWLGSPAMFDFLRTHLGDDAATFGGAFDIPLWLVSRTPGLWARFMAADYAEVPDLDDLE